MMARTDLKDAEVDRIIALSEAELRAEVAAAGLDWDEEVRRFDRIVERAKARAILHLRLRNAR